jgi:NAD(P)-dependent dehydrogenase (short-subunit alcohol dehydrogenase family)
MASTVSDFVVVITGASSGIGRATALRIAERRGTAVLASRQPDALREVARECEELGGRALPVPTDVTDEAQVRNLAREAAEAYGRIDAWVNDAAVTMMGRFEESPAEAFRRVMETNFFGYVHGARAVLPYFREQGQGVLINVASVIGKVGGPYATAYAASKSAVIGFSDSLRMELLDMPDIHICTVLPATIDTPLFQHAANYADRQVRAMPPVYAPEEAAEVIVQLIGNPQREVTVGNAGRMIALRRLGPAAVTERILAKKVEKQHFQDRPNTSPGPGNLFEPMPQFNAAHGGWQEFEKQASQGPGQSMGALALVAGLGAALYWIFGDRAVTSRSLSRTLRSSRT